MKKKFCAVLGVLMVLYIRLIPVVGAAHPFGGLMMVVCGISASTVIVAFLERYIL